MARVLHKNVMTIGGILILHIKSKISNAMPCNVAYFEVSFIIGIYMVP